jgi:hypothetical protein
MRNEKRIIIIIFFGAFFWVSCAPKPPPTAVPLGNVQVGSDPNYDWTSNDRNDFINNFKSGASTLTWNNSSPPSTFDKADFLARVGLTGSYDFYANEYARPPFYLNIRDYAGEAHGSMTLVQPVQLDFGTCEDIHIPITTFPIHLTVMGPQITNPSNPNNPQITRFEATGSTTREISLGSRSGEMILNIQMELENSYVLPCTPDNCSFLSILSAYIQIDVPDPCEDKNLAPVWLRRNDILFEAFGYQ